MKFNDEKIRYDLANIAADQYLKKDLTKHMGTIIENIKVINDTIDLFRENDHTAHVDFLIELVYEFYRMKENAELSEKGLTY